MISWKFEHKTGIPVSVFKAFCKRQLSAGYDCVFINPMIGNEAYFRNTWIQGEFCHHGMMRIAKHLQQHDDIETQEHMGTENFSFCNFFVGTKYFWDKYLSFVDAAVAGLEAQGKAGTEVGKIFTGNGKYGRDPGASMRIFVIERLFSSLIKTRTEIRCAPFPHTKNDYTRKFGNQLGVLLYRLSLVKNRALTADDANLTRLWNETVKDLGKKAHIQNILGMDDPDEIYLGKQYAKLTEHASRLDPDDH